MTATRPLALAAASLLLLAWGGPFLQTESSLHLPGVEGGSMAILGFDRRSDEFNTVGMDIEGTYWVTAKGSYNEQARVITMSGEDYDPILSHVQEYDFRIRLVDDDTYVTELWFKDAVHTRGGPPHDDRDHVDAALTLLDRGIQNHELPQAGRKHPFHRARVQGGSATRSRMEGDLRRRRGASMVPAGGAGDP